MAQIRLLARRVSKDDAGHHLRGTTQSGERIWATKCRISKGLACPGLDPGLLRSANGTSTMSPIAPGQNPWKCRSYGSILNSFGIRCFMALFIDQSADGKSQDKGRARHHNCAGCLQQAAELCMQQPKLSLSPCVAAFYRVRQSFLVCLIHVPSGNEIWWNLGR